MLVTVSSLGIITAWRFSTKGMRRGDTSLVREATLCGARNVVCIAVSRAWSLLVTGSADGNAMVWDMNGLTYIRTLETPRNDSLRFMAVNEANVSTSRGRSAIEVEY
jgi:WD40 repeat protein